MLATIWMCTQEWSLIWSLAMALTFETCQSAFSSVSSFTRSRIERSLRLPRAGTRIRICATACAGVMRASRSSSAAGGASSMISSSGSC